MARRRNRTQSEFRPDRKPLSLPKLFFLTQVQRSRIAKWSLYVLTMILTLTVQDVILGRMRLLGATTDLPAMLILLITVIEGVDVGSLFVLITSVLYYCSGTAPSPYCVILLSAIGIFASLTRQVWLHRSKGAIVFSAGVGLMAYELALFVVGLAQGLTHFSRFFVFVLTGAYSWALMLPMYDLINRIGLIGGNTWKE